MQNILIAAFLSNSDLCSLLCVLLKISQFLARVFIQYQYQRASIMHQWYKSYGHFTEGVDFAYWWSFIGKGLCLQSAQQACFIFL